MNPNRECARENLLFKRQSHAGGLAEESPAAASSAGLRCLVAKHQILIISHQVSPVNAGLHPDVKYTHIFSQTTPLLAGPPLAAAGMHANCLTCSVESMRCSDGLNQCRRVTYPGGFEASGCECVYLCLGVCGYLRTRG